jgi:hypothetical protein
MSMAVSMDWLAAGPARAPERRRVGRQRARPALARTERPIALWAVSCFVCATVGPAFERRERALLPSLRSGWRYRVIAQVGGWLCGECDWKYRTMLPPATRGDCQDGPRPCRALLCRYNLWFDISRKAKKGAEVAETCALDVADQGGLMRPAVGTVISMTKEGVRYLEMNALDKLRAIPGLAFDFEDEEDGDA